MAVSTPLSEPDWYTKYWLIVVPSVDVNNWLVIVGPPCESSNKDKSIFENNGLETPPFDSVGINIFKLVTAVCISVNVGIYQSLYPLWEYLFMVPAKNPILFELPPPSAFIIFWVCL